jgi:type I restriction enzyme, S subunit
MTFERVPLRRLVECLDGKRVPMNREERSGIPGDVPYWGSGGIVDHIAPHLFNEPLVLLGEDGAPFFDKTRPVSFVIDGPSWVNNHIHVLRPRAVEPRFLSYALNTVDYGRYISGSTRDKLTQEEMWTIRVPRPHENEQRRIADFLDDQVARLDAAISLHLRQMTLLEERSTAALSRCMTGDSAGPMAHAVLGPVSDDTAPTKLVRAVRQIAVGVVVNPSTYFVDDGVPFIHGYNVRDGWLDLTEHKRMLPSDSLSLPRSRLLGGEVLVVRAGYPGRAAVVPAELAGANCASVLVLRCGPTILPEYLATFFNAPQGRGQVKVGQYGAAQEVISAGQVAEYTIPLVPLAEQRRRLDLLDAEVRALAQADELAKRHRALLEERKQALITAAVTGQFDVTTARAVA